VRGALVRSPSQPLLEVNDSKVQPRVDDCIHLAERLEDAEIEPGEEGTEAPRESYGPQLNFM
jgi:hypothetical protein